MANVEKCNMVALAGTIETIKIQEGRAFVLVNPGGDTKFIPCTVHKEPELVKKLSSFEKGDDIKVSGFIRAWAQQKNGEWKNNVEVRIVAIKNEPPKRAPKAQGTAFDNDIPEEYR